MSTRSGRISRISTISASPTRNKKGVSPSRSPGRTRKASPPRSVQRKSPARKSPSRKPASKFPARKSPSRTTKEATDSAQKSPSKRQAIKSEINIQLQDATKTELFRGGRTRRSEYSIKDLPSVDKLEVNGVQPLDTNDVFGIRNRKPFEELAPRRSGRIREYAENMADIRRSLSSMSKSVSKSVSQSIDTFSDEDSEQDQLKIKDTASRKLATPLRGSVGRLVAISGRWEFGGRFGSALLILLIPAVVFGILNSCKTSCSTKGLWDLSTYKSYKALSAWFNLEALAVITAQWIIQGLLTLVPLGKTVDQEETGKKLYFNGWLATTLTIAALFTLTFFKVFIGDQLLVNYLKLAVVSYIFAVILSIILYVKSRKLDDSALNPYGNTGNVLYDFCLGRELHPYYKHLDIKLWISRITNINSLILLVLIFKQGILFPAKETEILSPENYKDFLGKVQLKPTTLLFSMMQIIYILNFILKENQITTTFFWQSEGLGYLQLVSSALYPFYFTTIAKFVAEKEVTLTTNALLAASGVFLLGYSIMLISNNIKHEFRTNPTKPGFTNLDSIVTFHGKKLLISNVWRFVRHPNYAGDILIHIALALPGILTKQYVAAGPALLTIVVLLHRALRDHTRCRRRYGAAWERYCKRVPKVILPKIL